jgi:hypothetical protein
MLILPISDHRITFHLSVPLLISFINVSQFSENRTFTSLVRFIPKYFNIFDTTVNGVWYSLDFECPPKALVPRWHYWKVVESSRCRALWEALGSLRVCPQGGLWDPSSFLFLILWSLVNKVSGFALLCVLTMMCCLTTVPKKRWPRHHGLEPPKQ